ncbi:MAG: hypothetical protein ACREJO_01240 [Phycisphaerales bacterium]
MLSARSIAALGGAYLALTGVAAAQPIVIDDFTDGAITLTADYTNPPITTGFIVSQTGISGAIGAARTEALSYIGAPGPGVLADDRARLRVNPAGAGSLDLSADAGVLALVVLQYDANSFFGLNGNIGAGGATGIRLEFIRNDQLMPIEIVLNSGRGTPATSTVVLTHNAPASNTPFNLDFAFADFALILGAGINLADVDLIEVRLNPQVAGDFTLDTIVTIPTPGATAAFAFAAFSASRRRRR